MTNKKPTPLKSEIKEEINPLYLELGELLEHLPKKAEPTVPQDELDHLLTKWEDLCKHLHNFKERFAKGASTFLE